jgi:MFS family permease
VEFDGGLPYYLPPLLATQLTTIAFHLLGVAALFIAARRQAGHQVAWGLTALYCGSAYVMGVGGTGDMIGGMTFISHIAPPAVSLLAFACLPRPLLAGTFLATAVATLFYPMFFIPAWLGYYWGNRTAVFHFIAGMALATVLIGVPVLTSSQAAEGRGLIGTILHDTMGHQQDPAAYGSSPFGFWGLRGGIRETLREPLVAGNYNTSPSFLIFAVFVVAAFFLARGSTLAQLALLTGALAIGAQMWKIHATGVYVTWYYPFLLLGLFAGSRDPLTMRPRPAGASPPGERRPPNDMKA